MRTRIGNNKGGTEIKSAHPSTPALRAYAQDERNLLIPPVALYRTIILITLKIHKEKAHDSMART